MTDESTAVATIPDEGVTVRTERISEERFEAGDEASGAKVVAMALPKTYAKKDASNGVNITAAFEIDSAYATEFNDCVEAATYLLKVAGKEYGEVQIVGVTTKFSQTDSMAHTVVGVHWAANQEKFAKAFHDLIGKTVRLEVWEIQLQVFGSTAE